MQTGQDLRIGSCPPCPTLPPLTGRLRRAFTAAQTTAQQPFAGMQILTAAPGGIPREVSSLQQLLGYLQDLMTASLSIKRLRHQHMSATSPVFLRKHMLMMAVWEGGSSKLISISHSGVCIRMLAGPAMLGLIAKIKLGLQMSCTARGQWPEGGGRRRSRGAVLRISGSALAQSANRCDPGQCIRGRSRCATFDHLSG